MTDGFELLRQRQVAYKQVFGDLKDAASAAVTEDLGRFCRAKSSTFDPDARLHALLEGRREVFLRILDHLSLPFDELCKKYGAKKTDA